MTTVRDLQIPSRANDPDLRSPLYQDSTVWKVVSDTSLTNGCDHPFTRFRDSTGILDDLAKAVGPATAMCVLGDNVIGVADWEQISLAEQYHAVTAKAGAFVASNMLYLRLSGPDAASALNMLTPRNVHGLASGRAMFTLFTTPDGTIDDEAIVVRTGDQEYLVSCGGGKPLSCLPDALKTYSRVTVDHPNIVSFNIKGPRRMEAMQSLVHTDDRAKLSSMQTFQACRSRTPDGDPVWIVRTVVGIEMWGEAPVIRRTWHHILEHSDLITPCGWDLLNVYRMECTSMVFALFPLDVHLGTTLWETGYGWMVENGEEEFFVGQAALEQSKNKERFWLGGLKANGSIFDAPPVGAEIYTRKGEFAGYVTSAAFSIKHKRALAFAHLKKECSPGEILALNSDQEWAVCSLPFTGKS